MPWKYGFKGIKSIVKITFVDKQPRTTWHDERPSEYGFYANVNPEVDHPRWSQASERRIGEFLEAKTLMFNGYADQVATLYQGWICGRTSSAYAIAVAGALGQTSWFSSCAWFRSRSLVTTAFGANSPRIRSSTSRDGPATGRCASC